MSIEMDIAVVEKVLGGFTLDPDAWSETDEVRYYLYSGQLSRTPQVIRGIAYAISASVCACTITDNDAQWYDRKWTRFSPSERIEDAWVVVEQITRVPQSRAEAERMANTRFGLWWDRAALWAYSEREAAEAICAAALAAVEKERIG